MLSLFQDEVRSVSQEEVLAEARSNLISFLNKGKIPNWDEFALSLDQDIHQEVIKKFYERLIHWTFLDDVIASEATEFFFHGPTSSQKLACNGEKIDIHLAITEDEWQLWLEIVSITFKQNWNVKNPFCSFYGRLKGKDFRLSLVHFSTSPFGVSKLVLRHLSSQDRPLSEFHGKTDLSTMIREKKNILIAGSTGSGKTSLLTSLIHHVPSQEHLIILEDTYEIITSHPHQTRFLASDLSERSLKDYLHYSLRLSPDRLILGEMRSHEVIPFLMAMNTGHKGLMGTIHAGSAHEAINRMALLFTLYAPEAQLSLERVIDLICQNIEIIVFMENKRIKEVIRIYGSEKGVAFYEYLEGHQETNLS